MKKVLCWLWLTPAIITIGSGVWASTAGASVASGITQKAQSWQDQTAHVAAVPLDDFTYQLTTAPVTALPGKPMGLVGTDPDTGTKWGGGVDAGVLTRPVVFKAAALKRVNDVTLTTKATGSEAFAKSITAHIETCTKKWVVTPATSTCPGESKVLVGDTPVAGNTVNVLSKDDLAKPDQIHLLLELRAPSDAGTSAAGKEAELAFLFAGTTSP